MHVSSSVIRVNLSGCLNDWLSVVLRHLPPDNYRLIFHAQNHSLSPAGIPQGIGNIFSATLSTLTVTLTL